MKAYRWPLLLALALALAIGWWAGQQLRTPDDARYLPPDPACDLAAGPCARVLPDGARLVLTVEPRPPQVMVPLTLSVALDRPAGAVWVDFAGLNMDMGFNRAELGRNPEGLWKGQVILPVCSAAEMHWEAQVFVASQEGLTAVPFRFVTRP